MYKHVVILHVSALFGHHQGGTRNKQQRSNGSLQYLLISRVFIKSGKAKKYYRSMLMLFRYRFGCIRKLREAVLGSSRLAVCVCLVCLFTCNNSSPTGWIFMKLVIEYFFENLLREIHVLLKYDPPISKAVRLCL